MVYEETQQKLTSSWMNGPGRKEENDVGAQGRRNCVDITYCEMGILNVGMSARMKVV